MVANEVGIREDRQKKYDFSKPYISSSAALVIAKDKDKPATFADVKGLKGAQSLTSNYADIAKKNGAEIEGVEGFSQAAELLASGRVDFTINDKLSVLNYLETKKDAKIKIVDTEKASQSGFLFRKGSDKLVQEVDKALEDMKKDGTYDKITKNGSVKMYLSSALVSDRLSTWIDIMQTSFMPMLKEAVLQQFH